MADASGSILGGLIVLYARAPVACLATRFLFVPADLSRQRFSCGMFLAILSCYATANACSLCVFLPARVPVAHSVANTCPAIEVHGASTCVCAHTHGPDLVGGGALCY